MTPCVSEISVWWLVLLVTVYAVPLLASFAVADTNCLIPIAWEDIPSYSITNVPSRFFFAVGTWVDSDNDGLPDAYEHFVTDTRADNPDTDFDGLLDYEEWNLGLSPLNSDDAVQDPDGDGIPTLYEIRTIAMMSLMIQTATG